jgi:hypothetical protein
LCIGQVDKAYHRLLCHPYCLCQDIAEMPQKLKVLASSQDFQEEVTAFQETALHKHFYRRPLDLLQQASTMKSGKSTRDPIRVRT